MADAGRPNKGDMSERPRYVGELTSFPNQAATTAAQLQPIRARTREIMDLSRESFVSMQPQYQVGELASFSNQAATPAAHLQPIKPSAE